MLQKENTVQKENLIKEWKKVLIDAGVTEKQVAAKLGKAQPTLNKQVNGFTFRYTEFVNILDMLGYDVVWVKRQSDEVTVPKTSFRHNAENKNDWGAEKPSAEKA